MNKFSILALPLIFLAQAQPAFSQALDSSGQSSGISPDTGNNSVSGLMDGVVVTGTSKKGRPNRSRQTDSFDMNFAKSSASSTPQKQHPAQNRLQIIPGLDAGRGKVETPSSPSAAGDVETEKKPSGANVLGNINQVINQVKGQSPGDKPTNYKTNSKYQVSDENRF